MPLWACMTGAADEQIVKIKQCIAAESSKGLADISCSGFWAWVILMMSGFPRNFQLNGDR